jgi:transcriptional regulator with XRE-family HTH domain
MFRRRKHEEPIDRYIRERIRQARAEANKTQDELAKAVYKNRVTISDIERGRVQVGAADLALIAAELDKPISYFYPPVLGVHGDLSPLEEELLANLAALEEPQQFIALEYVKQQVEITTRARSRERGDDIAESMAEHGPTP